ncbi:MAG: hypothetical protein R3E09_12990 [Novosphingobium sp.]|nr:hypothetical protein [Novosphingobium sp.]
MESYRQLVDLAVLCHDATADREKDIVQANLPSIARDLNPAARRTCDARIRELTECNACLQAVIEALPASWGYMLSRGYNGRRLASVFCPLLESEMTTLAETEALALLGALATTVATTLNCEEVQS